MYHDILCLFFGTGLAELHSSFTKIDYGKNDEHIEIFEKFILA